MSVISPAQRWAFLFNLIEYIAKKLEMPNNELSTVEYLVRSFIGPLLSAFGFIATIYIAYRLYKWRNQVKAPAWAWDRYLETLIALEEYEEVKRIKQLLVDKDYYDKIKTPKGYTVRKRDKLDLEDRFEEMTFVVGKSYVFTRKADKGAKGFEVKEEK
jgi:hypothetical protein